MRVIVPLQGVVQGRGGLVLGSVIPCALFYFLQLYLKRHRSDPAPPPAVDEEGESSTGGCGTQVPSRLSEGTLSRSLSRSILSPRGSTTVYVSSRAGVIAREGEGGCKLGISRVLEDPYHPADNPNGFIQLGFGGENIVSLCGVGCFLNFNI